MTYNVRNSRPGLGQAHKVEDYKFMLTRLLVCSTSYLHTVKPVCKGHSMEPENVPLWAVALCIQVNIACQYFDNDTLTLTLN
jgi:hypothetical protein